MRGSLPLLLVMFMYTLWAAPTSQQIQQEKRVALVIVNGAYENAPLPSEQAGSVVRTFLEKSGFRVAYHENVNRRTLATALRSFTSAIRPGDIALFYYYGHATSQMRKNYLIPLEHSILDESQIRLQTIPLDPVLDNIKERHPRLGIVVLDTAYADPFGKDYEGETPGLASVSKQQGVDVFFSLFPGRTARTQNFTAMFTDVFSTKGMSLRQGADMLEAGSDPLLKPMILLDDTEPFYFRLP